MNGRQKAAIIIAAALVIIAVLVFLSVKTVHDAAKADGDETRESIMSTFTGNTDIYNELYTELKNSVRLGQEYVIITDGEKSGDIKVEYNDVEVNPKEELSQLISRFTGITQCDAIYCDGTILYIKREFKTALNQKSEANIFRAYTDDAKLPEGATARSGGWYYLENSIE